jgi:hypothetical protein
VETIQEIAMRPFIVLLAAAVLAAPFVAGCQENERKIERRETIHHESEPQPVVVPDAPQE